MKIERLARYYRYYALQVALRLNGQANGNMHTNGELNLVRRALRGNVKVIDVGANMGEWLDAAIAASSREGSSFIAVEADPEVFGGLTVRYKSVPQVRLLNRAVGREAGTAKFYKRKSQHGDSSLLQHYYLTGDDIQICEVAVITLDRLLADLGWDSVDFVKLDIEGSEVDALRGARESLKKKSIRHLQMEYSQTWLRSKTCIEDVWAICKDNGYRLFRIGPSRLYEFTSYHYTLDDFGFSNLLMVPAGEHIGIPVVSDWRPF